MKLRSLKYSEFKGGPQEWILEDILLGDSNLLVGKNSAGKSRTLNVISGLAKRLAGKTVTSLSTSSYQAEFIRDDGVKVLYELKHHENQVDHEMLSIGGKIKLIRDHGGVGKIYAVKMKKMLEFQAPTSVVAAVARRDEIQHPYLEELYTWAASFRKFCFGSSLGKNRLAIFPDAPSDKFDDTKSDEVIGLFRFALSKHGEKFRKSLIQDIQTMGYDISNVDLSEPISMRIEADLPGQAMCLFVQEKALKGVTDQHSMSQGMYRAIAILIHLNYAQFEQRTTSIAVDDIGEGLDFDRSCRLIDILRAKVNKSNIQLIMSTNDRFVMNKVPLEEWSIITREGPLVRVLNNTNSHELFEEFRFTGMSNFTFLEMDFANGWPNEEDE
jgi:energy-coupling factor transporter ATP-binding protein EcfA2